MDIMKKMFCQLNNKINSELKKKKKKDKTKRSLSDIFWIFN